MAKDLICTTTEKLPGADPGDLKGSPGTFNGEPNYPKATPGIIPEKTYEGGEYKKGG